MECIIISSEKEAERFMSGPVAVGKGIVGAYGTRGVPGVAHSLSARPSKVSSTCDASIWADEFVRFGASEGPVDSSPDMPLVEGLAKDAVLASGITWIWERRIPADHITVMVMSASHTASLTWSLRVGRDRLCGRLSPARAPSVLCILDAQHQLDLRISVHVSAACNKACSCW